MKPVITSILSKEEVQKALRIYMTALLLSYTSPPVWKLYPHDDIISKIYKPAFHSGHLPYNMPSGGAATI